MPKGKYEHKPRITETSKAIESFLGHKPKNVVEWKRIWHILFGKSNRMDKMSLRKQKQRHLSHTGPASNARRYCIFCTKEGLVWT